MMTITEIIASATAGSRDMKESTSQIHIIQS